MLVLRGAPALSAFRHDKLLSALKSRIAQITGVYGEFMHFADLEQSLSAQEQEILERILRYGPKAKVEEPSGQLILVIPRPGTISPWSSKATDIAKNCGLDAIKRLERGTSFYVQSEQPLSVEQIEQVKAELHDRMV